MTTLRNLLAGMGASAWTATINLVAVPFYLSYLGVESYALIGFYIVLQSLLAVLDLGMGPTVSREIARYQASGNHHDSQVMLHTFSVLYWGIALILAVTALAIAGTAATYWLGTEELPTKTISQAAILMGLVLAIRWPLGLYQAALIGMQRLAIVGAVNASFATLSAGAALAVLAFVSPTIEAFFLIQVLVALLHITAMRIAAWRALGRAEELRFDIAKLLYTWRFSAGAGAIALTSVFFTQLDKLVISRILGLVDFGYYALAGAVAGVLYIFVTPVFNIIYPRMSALLAEDKHNGFRDYYSLGTRMLAMVIFPIGITLAYYSSEVIMIWTGDTVVADNVGPIVRYLAIGSSVHAIMYFPYSAQLAFGNTTLPLLTNVALMTFSIPVLIFSVTQVGAIGGAYAWAGLQFSYLLLGSWLTHRFLLDSPLTAWLGWDVIMPLLCTATVVAIFGHFIDASFMDPWPRVLLGAMVGLLTISGLSLATTQTRTLVFDLFARSRNRAKWEHRPTL